MNKFIGQPSVLNYLLIPGCKNFCFLQLLLKTDACAATACSLKNFCAELLLTADLAKVKATRVARLTC